MQQYPFAFPVDTSYREEDFLSSDCNRDALLAVNDWAAKTQGRFLLRGPQASGKSHLAAIWAQHCTARIIPAASLSGHHSPEALFAEGNALVVEDIEQVAEEAALFHLLNLTAQSPYQLLLTVQDSACWSAFSLPDLRSRLQALPQARIDEPDEALLSALLVKQFHDRQLSISPNLPAYLMRRVERSFAAIQQTVTALDHLGSSKKRPVTIALAREYLDSL